MYIFAPISTHWFLFALFAVLILGMLGVIGRGLGLQNVFHEDPELISRYGANNGKHIYWNSPAIFGQAATISFLALIWGFSYTLGSDKAAGPLDISSMGAAVALQVLISTPISWVAGSFRFTDAVGELQPKEWLRCLIGAVLGFVGALAILGIGFVFMELILTLFPSATRWAPTVGLAISALLAVVIVLELHKLLAVVSLVCLLSVLAIIYALISIFPDPRQLLAIAAIVALIVLVNILRTRLKFEIPGIVDQSGNSHYLPGNQLEIAPADGDRQTGLSPLDALQAWKEHARRSPRKPTVKEGQVDPLDALKAWHERVGARHAGKPKLVMVATSGGAYRASFWTGLVLDKLCALDTEGALSGFRDNVRLITGASGGMVGGAYFAARARADGSDPGSIIDALEADILAVQDKSGEAVPDFPYKSNFPIPRDSLSPVAQQLVQRDVPGLLWPVVQRTDRGTVLEDQWITLDQPFSNMMPGEAAGWRPSIIFSPMLVETGQPLLIGNLDMDLIRDDRYQETVEFFNWFPASREKFKIKTAVRLNASFPYVAPASALPTRPYRRVVDAGYYDNYGVDLAVAYLSQPRLRDWITKYCSGVALVELRAFPFPLPDPGRPGAFKRGFQWLTTPLEGLLIARGSTMRFHNRQSLRRLKDSYHEITGTKFIRNVIFEVDAQASLNWYLPGRELTEMRDALDHEVNTEATQRLIDFW